MHGNQYVPWATGVGANALSPTDYAAATVRQLGAQYGIADPLSFNAAMRQASVVAAMVAQFTADYGSSDVNDDGNVTTLLSQFEAALQALITSLVQALTQGQNAFVHYAGSDSGTANSYIFNSPTPAVTSYSPGLLLLAKIANANTGPSIINVAGLGPVNITRLDLSPLQSGDLKAGEIALLECDGTQFQLASIIPNTSNLPTATSIQNSTWTGYDDTGTSDYLIISPSPAPTSYTKFQEWLIKKGASPNATTTPRLNVGGLGAVPLVNMDGSSIPVRGLPGGTIMKAIYDGANFRVISFASARIRLAADTTLYVNASTGNDSNSGSAGAPFASIQAAINYAQASLDLGGFNLTISVAAGTYGTNNIGGAWVGGGSSNVTISGDTSSPSLTVISTASGSCISAQGSGAGVTLKNLTMNSTGVNGLVAANQTASIILAENLTFGACPNSGHIFCAGSSSIVINRSYTINGGAASHWQIINGSLAVQAGVTITLAGTPNFTFAFASLTNAATIFCAATPTFSGSATGTRFIASGNSVINTNGATEATFLPGSTAGSRVSGAQWL